MVNLSPKTIQTSAKGPHEKNLWPGAGGAGWCTVFWCLLHHCYSNLQEITMRLYIIKHGFLPSCFADYTLFAACWELPINKTSVYVYWYWGPPFTIWMSEFCGPLSINWCSFMPSVCDCHWLAGFSHLMISSVIYIKIGTIWYNYIMLWVTKMGIPLKSSGSPSFFPTKHWLQIWRHPKNDWSKIYFDLQSHPMVTTEILTSMNWNIPFGKQPMENHHVSWVNQRFRLGHFQ